jgi:hypothetical protein
MQMLLMLYKRIMLVLLCIWHRLMAAACLCRHFRDAYACPGWAAAMHPMHTSRMQLPLLPPMPLLLLLLRDCC